MNHFWIPVATAVVSGIILLVIKRFFFAGEWRFFGYPKISGTYKAYYEKGVFPDGERAEDSTKASQPEQIEMHQFGSRIWGTIYDPNNDNHFKFSGNVTHTRVFTYQYRPADPRSLDSYGAGLLKLDKSGKHLKGYLVLLSRDKREPIALSYRYECLDQSSEADLPKILIRRKMLSLSWRDSNLNILTLSCIHKELRFASDVLCEIPPGQIYFIPVRLDECDVPNAVKNLQWVDIQNKNDYEQLFRAVEYE